MVGDSLKALRRVDEHEEGCGEYCDSPNKAVPRPRKVKCMAARNKRVRTTQSRASQHREELLEEARSLMASGRVREARAVASRAGQVEQLVGALESDVRAEDADR